MDNSTSLSLPIEDCLPEILQGLRQSRAVVLKAPPGAGKTTGVPPAILADQTFPAGKVLLVQPRRLAARAAAAQLARIIGCQIGDDVGYHVRFDRRESKRTRLLVLTYGMLLRRLQSDPLLEDVSCVLLDEFHERSLDADLALGMIERVRREFRDELRLVVMSATLDPEPLVAFLHNAIPVTSLGRMFPVEIHYRAPSSQLGQHRQSIVDHVMSALPEVLARGAGHVLVFLPGVGEIQRTMAAIDSSGIAANDDVMPLYADLAIEAQDRVLRPSSRRKIILATNVAETSITIDGVTAVIDTGQARVMRFEPNVGLPRLRIESISQASADQRSGRAGRTQPGVGYRLWHAAAHRGRASVDVPEILRADFAPAALTLATWGERDAAAFPWLDPPREHSVQTANTLLKRLGAIDDTRRATALGQAMSELPVHPRLAKLLIDAAAADVVEDASIAVALLTERDPFQIPGSGLAKTHGGDFLEAVSQLRRELSARRLSPTMKNIDRVAKHLAGSVEQLSIPPAPSAMAAGSPERLARVLLAAFPDRVARRRELGGTNALMVGGKGVRLETVPALRDCELLLCLNVNAVEGDARVSYACRIERDWLDSKFLRSVDEPLFNDDTQTMIARRRETFLDLVLHEAPIQCRRGPLSARVLADQADLIWKQKVPPDNELLGSYLSRIAFLRGVLGGEELPLVEKDFLDELRTQLAIKCLSLAELARAPWVDAIRGQFTYHQQQWIEREAPQRMKVPSGNEIAIIYEVGKPPVMKVRLQELLGWHDTPRIARGRVPIQLHLLGPNYRTQQITDDLRRFWETTYTQVRKDLRARYPKHQWPEDPFTATATRNAMKPRT